MNYSIKYILAVLMTFSPLAFSQQSIKPWMGVHIEEAAGEGVLIQKSVQGTPAFKAGLISKDIVLKIDDTKVNSPKELIDAVVSKGVGHSVKVKFLRNNKSKSVTLKLEAMPGMLELAKRNLLNKTVPSFKLKNLNHKNKDIFELSKDKPKIIEFWATWCGACLQAQPIINKFMDKNNTKIQFISISTERTIKIKKYLKQKASKIQENIFYLNDESSEIDDTFFVPAFPMFFVLDKNNIVKHIAVGTGENLDDVFEQALLLSK